MCPESTVVDIAQDRIPLALFALRIGVFIVMLMWTLDKFVLHAVSTLASFRMYLGLDNLLFFAAWPMLAAAFALYLLRDLDTLCVVRVRSSAH